MERTTDLLDAQRKISELEAQLQKALKERQAERAGRIRAQQDLRTHLASSADVSRGVEGPTGAFPMVPIGILRSCFSTRNGTPRQPLLVPLSRSRLDLPAGTVPPAALEGLEGYSHCWLLYVFHQNTDLTRLWQDKPFKGLRAKVGVPKLDGERVGVFATRSPHRPSPIGLSVAKIDRVEGRSLYLSGADLVEGTPILDIKPYLPFSDSLPKATTPSWIQEDRATNPFKRTVIEFEPGLKADMDGCWEKVEKRSLYKSAEEVLQLVAQVLATDIRSAHQRHEPRGRLRDSFDNNHSERNDFDVEGKFGEGIKNVNGGEIDVENVLSSGVDCGRDDNRTSSSRQNVSQYLGGGERREGGLQVEGEGREKNVGGKSSNNLVEYHLVLEGIDFKYTIDSQTRQVSVFGAELMRKNKSDHPNQNT